jgi:predicted nucleotidyltransferase
MKKEQLELIKNKLMELNPHRAILFGSHSMGTAKEGSDVDLIVILDVDGMPKSFGERMENHSMVRRRLRSMNKEIPMDVLVYTKSEWETLAKMNSSFFREIVKTGKAII